MFKEKRAALPKIRAKKAARAARVGESGVPIAVYGKMFSTIRGHLKTHRGGCRMLPH